MQLSSLAITLILAAIMGPSILGLQVAPKAILVALLILPLALALGYLEGRMEMKYSFLPDFLPESRILAFILFILIAPTSEELLYRGLLEGFLLPRTFFWLAIIVPAILFAILHLAPFKNAPPRIKYTIVTEAFILGILAGFLRGFENSIIPAIILHIEFNLWGVLHYR